MIRRRVGCADEQNSSSVLNLLVHCLQVPQATGLTIRVINNVVKKMDVKPRFYEAFRKDGYPATFEYRQKVHQLFQLVSQQ